ncbi:hypothetical protein BD779DRAFT_1493256, partial [Infundibulicybe gibba]
RHTENTHSGGTVGTSDSIDITSNSKYVKHSPVSYPTSPEIENRVPVRVTCAQMEQTHIGPNRTEQFTASAIGGHPGVISLLAGNPNPSTFPFTSLSFSARSPTDPTKETSLKIEGPELAEGLQYGDTTGLEKLCAGFMDCKSSRTAGSEMKVGRFR